MIESLSAWMGRPASARELIRKEWQSTVYRSARTRESFDAFWDRAVHDGFVSAGSDLPRRSFRDFRAEEAGPAAAASGLSVQLYSNVAMPSQRHAHNAWLHEVPDPVTKLVWENCAIVSPATAARLGLSSGDVILIRSRHHDGGREIRVPAWVQTGQTDNVIGLPLHYGRYGTERFTRVGPEWIGKRPTVPPAGLVGVNAAPLSFWNAGQIAYAAGDIKVVRTGSTVLLACSQPYSSIDTPAIGPGHSGDRRPLVQETTLGEYRRDPSSGSRPRHVSKSMWPEEHEYTGHHWGMVIDLNACTGCSACVVSCQAENNIPTVGKDEVMRNRDMHWLRIDRYIYDEAGATHVAFQPMMCHQCDNAPCETVCPVEATVHSSEGLNQQVYNRCVGTRYCANNCPYKIRRFNWFDYPYDDDLQRMVLNPDVVVRSRGVMEKCTFCVQRIQEAKIESKRTGARVSPDDLKTACQQSCPADAIVFGDMNDADSPVARGIEDPRHYRLLEELEVRPSVGYKTIVRNSAEAKG